jgi:hypothetical protein
MKLFEDKLRLHLEPSTHNENSYDYYDRSARKDVSKVRDVLNEWFKNYPESEKVELKQRLKKKFPDAFYELYLFNLFKQQGFNIEIHPIVPNSHKKPDFLISKGGIEFYLEAKVAKGESEEQESQKKRINEIYDSLNTIKSPNFFLNVEELTLNTKIQPTTRQIRNLVEKELEKFDPDNVSSQIQNFGIEGSPKIIIENSNLKLAISLIPKDKQYRNKGGRPIGIYHGETFWGGDEDSIKNSFAKKAKRYGELNKPYIVCINTIGSRFSGDYDVMNAVWGTCGLSWSNDPNAKDDKIVRLKNGLFLSNRGPIFQNVSGVLITYVMEFNIPVSKYWFIKHPFSNYDLDFEIFDMTFQYIRDRQIITRNGKTVGEIFNINSNWLDE